VGASRPLARRSGSLSSTTLPPGRKSLYLAQAGRTRTYVNGLLIIPSYDESNERVLAEVHHLATRAEGVEDDFELVAHAEAHDGGLRCSSLGDARLHAKAMTAEKGEQLGAVHAKAVAGGRQEEKRCSRPAGTSPNRLV
jgi:hypothetical protein